ncbi:MAG TPA: DUF3368 domain-containing protein [Anaerolineales bacterium]|nr:DUF3368 domain-containing protein [Anaerolineales bacterium]
MSIVSNTGPLIALAKVNQLRLLEVLYQQVHLPPAVHRELLAKTGVEAERLDQALATFIRVADPLELTPEVQAATLSLGAGEREAVALAHHMRLLLVMDDQLGRQAAQGLDLEVTGTAGVLILAKQKGLIESVRKLLELMREHGYWLSDELITTAAELAGEE